ncbi:MAG TPA: type II/IV secretion system protein [Nitrospirae bacterium]|nr:type II/IV secretion system protein [Nitrospirota bacterium]
MARKKIGELLKEKGLIKESQIHVAIEQQKITGAFLGETLIKLGFVSSKEISQCLAEQSGLEYIDLREYPVSEDALRLIPKDMAERGTFIPIELRDNKIVVGVIDPNNIVAIDTVTRYTQLQPVIYLVDSEAFYDTLEKAYFFLENPVKRQIEETVQSLKTGVVASHISRLSELIIMDGIRKNSTDIHITPSEETVHVFYRVDGILQHGFCFPKNAQSGVISKIKVMSELDIAEQRLPQDGSFSFNFLGKNYDMRVSTVPTIYGENIVIRILSGSGPLTRLEALGFDTEETKKLRLLFKKPHGIILITGPTGSGKTTTLYAALREVNLLEKNVLTVEDPVEYRLSLVKQTEVNLKAGYDFALAGRNFMRQDPDVMLLGEIRDEETASIAIRASITGHLVLSTLHTNDAITAIPRLFDLGVDSFLLSSSLLAIVAQRLVRKICPHCREEHSLDDESREMLQFYNIKEIPPVLYRGRGCKVCNLTGYLGRTAIGEIFIIDDEIKDLVTRREPVHLIRDLAVQKGMKPLIIDGLNKVSQGITTIDEILRVAG